MRDCPEKKRYFFELEMAAEETAAEAAAQADPDLTHDPIRDLPLDLILDLTQNHQNPADPVNQEDHQIEIQKTQEVLLKVKKDLMNDFFI